MDMDLSPKFSKPVFEGEGGSYYPWSSEEFPVLGEAKVGAGVLVLKPGGFALPHYADCSKVGYVLQGEHGVAALVAPKSGKTEEIVLGLQTGDVIPVPSGSTSWWYNHGDSDVIIVFLGETAKAYVQGQFTYFFLTGAGGILGGFSAEVISRAYNINENEANILAKSQTGVLIVKLNPEERKSMPPPDQNIASKWIKNNTKHLPDVDVERAVQVFYVARGSAKVQIVGLNSMLVLDNKIVAGQLLVVPRFFTVSIIAEGEGMECFSIKTTSRPADVADLASKKSVLNAFAPSILQSSLNVPPAFVNFFKGQMAKIDVLIPPMN